MKVAAFFTLLFSLTFSFSALAVRHVGNGGRGVVCRDTSGAIKSAELLDLFEARVIYGLQLVPSLPTYEMQLTWLIGKSQYGFWLNRQKIKKEFEDKALFLGPEMKLTEVVDSFEPVIPVNCNIEQVANYHQSGKILINKDIWDAFDNLNKAALVAHEISYEEARSRGHVETSYYVRRFVGYLFSTEQLDPYVKPTGYDITYYCRNEETFLGFDSLYEMYMVANKCSKEGDSYCDAKIIFKVLGGQVVYDRTEMDTYISAGVLSDLESKRDMGENSIRGKVFSKIFEGSEVLFSVSSEAKKRVLSVALYADGEQKLMTPLKCELQKQ